MRIAHKLLIAREWPESSVYSEQKLAPRLPKPGSVQRGRKGNYDGPLAPGPWWGKGKVLGVGGAGSLWAENGGRRRPEDARGRGRRWVLVRAQV